MDNPIINLKQEPPKSSGSKLTVILRDDGPLLNAGDHSNFRRVTINLSEAQIEQLLLKPVASSMGKVIYEDVSICFLED